MWPWNCINDLKKTIPHAFYTMSSFVHHFKAMGEFKLELQSRNAQFGSKSVIFLLYVTLKFDRWSSKIIGYLFYAASSFVHNFKAISELKLELQSGNAQFRSKSMFFVLCDHEIWWMTIIICEFKLELQSGNCYIGFWHLWPWPLTSDLDFLHGHHFCHW